MVIIANRYQFGVLLEEDYAILVLPSILGSTSHLYKKKCPLWAIWTILNTMACG